MCLIIVGARGGRMDDRPSAFICTGFHPVRLQAGSASVNPLQHRSRSTARAGLTRPSVGCAQETNCPAGSRPRRGRQDATRFESRRTSGRHRAIAVARDAPACPTPEDVLAALTPPYRRQRHGARASTGPRDRELGSRLAGACAAERSPARAAPRHPHRGQAITSARPTRRFLFRQARHPPGAGVDGPCGPPDDDAPPARRPTRGGRAPGREGG